MLEYFYVKSVNSDIISDNLRGLNCNWQILRNDGNLIAAMLSVGRPVELSLLSVGIDRVEFCIINSKLMPDIKNKFLNYKALINMKNLKKLPIIYLHACRKIFVHISSGSIYST